jgi:hypothetical protein
MREQIKAIVGGLAGAVSGVAATGVLVATIFPPGVEVPWYGYLIAAGIVGIGTYFGVWHAPANKPEV